MAVSLPPFVYCVVLPRHGFILLIDFVAWVLESVKEKSLPDVRLLQARRRHPMVSTPAGSKSYRTRSTFLRRGKGWLSGVFEQNLPLATVENASIFVFAIL